MKRGIFIRNVALSTIGIGLFSTRALASPLSFFGSPAQQWLQRLGSAFATRQRSAALVDAQGFSHARKAAIDFFAKHQYHPNSKIAHFFGQDESWCFFPVYAEQAMPNGLDLLLPVFHRDAANNWHQVRTLSSFQVEALSKVAQSLGDHSPAELADLLMPARKGGLDQGGAGYYTRNGMVSIRTTSIEGKTQTTCRVSTPNGLTVFNETYLDRGLSLA